MHDRVIGGVELRPPVGRQRNHALAVEDRAHGDPRRLLDQHDAGAVEREHAAQAAEQSRQHGLAIEAAGERHRRLAQRIRDAPGPPFGFEREPAVGDISRHGQHRRRQAIFPRFGNQLAIEMPRSIGGRKTDLEPLGLSACEDPAHGRVPLLDQLGRHPHLSVRPAHEVTRRPSGYLLDCGTDVEVSHLRVEARDDVGQALYQGAKGLLGLEPLVGALPHLGPRSRQKLGGCGGAAGGCLPSHSHVTKGSGGCSIRS